MANVLIVDDEKSIRVTMGRFLQDDGHDVRSAEDADEALSLLGSVALDVVVSDIILPRVNGVELLKRIRSVAPLVQVIMMTGEPTVNTASEAVRAGAFDYLTKPISKEAIRACVRRAAQLKKLDDEKRVLTEENRRYREDLEQLVEARTLALQESEKQLRQAQKMEAIGRLAGGVAHDFNNLLTVILGCTQFASESIPSDSVAQDDLKEVLGAGRRAKDLTRQLLAFSRQQILIPRVVDVNELVQNLQKMLGRLLGEDITLQIEAGDGVPEVKADPGQLEQIVMNLIVNARDAMPTGGRLAITTEMVELDASAESSVVDPAGFAPGTFAAIRVSDTGSGMSEEVLSHVFDPFFTTKGEGEGTGLGLSTVYGIVKQHEGFLSVDSTVGAGTTFTIYFPPASSEDRALAPGAEDTAALRGGSETVLLVEDDPGVLSITSRMLRGGGYNVLEADCARSALQIAQTRVAPIDLLISDVVMPGMDGRRLAEQLQAQRPEIRVILASGYTGDRLAGYGVETGGICFLHKPFDESELFEKVGAALGTDR